MDWRERWALADHNLVYAGIFLLFILLQLLLGWYWSREPAPFAVGAVAGTADAKSSRPGVVLAQTLSRVSATLLDKPGGYLRNDVLPPGLLMDNMPAWELGVLRQVRDMSRSLHRDLGLSHAQFIEDHDLAEAETDFNAKSDSWAFPAAETELRRGTEALDRYGKRLQQGREDAQFYARREYLLRWLGDVDGHLGQLSSRLNAALPDHPAVMRPLPGEPLLPHAEETSWWEVDDVFYEARGSAWALMHLLKAVEIDFAPELERQQAQLSLRAAIHELEATQQAVWSPVILNGSGFGLFANHSLVMANYLSRARTDLADVRALLRDADQAVRPPFVSTSPANAL
jgi:hypothetical protein